MATKTSFKSEKTHILDARVLFFNVGSIDGKYISPEEIEHIGFRITSEEAFNFEHKTARIILNVAVDATLVGSEQEESQEVTYGREIEGLGIFRLGFSFALENFDQLVRVKDQKEQQIQVDKMAMLHLLAMAYSTARGIILVKTQGTSLEGALLPVIDPENLMDKEPS